jgi:hypothetical protein
MIAEMLAKLCAILLLALAASPLTAPFQTYNEVHATLVVPFNGDDDSGSLLAPLVTTTTDRSVTPVAPAVAFGTWYVPSVTALASRCTLRCDGNAASSETTVLRI